MNDFDSNCNAQRPHPAGEICWQQKFEAVPSASVCSVSSCSNQLLLLG